MRNSSSIPDEPKGKQMQHYINGLNDADGMHHGIRKECVICNPHEWAIYSCTLHQRNTQRIIMYYFVCSCGIHSQCWDKKETAEKVAIYHGQTLPMEWEGVTTTAKIPFIP